MRWTFRIVTAAALAVWAAAAYADPPGRVARLSYASGAVSFAPGEAPDRWVHAVINRPLIGGDRLWADRDGRAEFQAGATAVRIAPLTSVDVLYLDDDRMQLRLAQGSANLRVRVLDPDDLVEVATPAGAVLIRQPGSYRISVDPHGEATRVAVNFGQAEVVTPGRDLTVPSGQAVALYGYAPPAFEVAAAGDEFDRWSAERDRRYERVASTRYVSPYMTGHEDLDHYGSWRSVPEYGAVWVPARVAPDWAPYRHGHWAWVSPWGWTWIDDAPWGFAPFHYGRWVHVNDHWAWAPGPIVRRPVYAPALVAFVGGPRWSVSVSSGPAVGWFPLGWREPYRPWYRASHRHVHNVNVTHVTNVTNITHVTHVHRHRPDAVTVVSHDHFVSARPVAGSRVNVRREELTRAELIRDRSPAEPVRASLAPERPGHRPPGRLAAREVLAVTPPAGASVRQPLAGDRGALRADDEPRVRVVNREELEARRGEREARERTRVEEREQTERRDGERRLRAEQRERSEAEQRARAEQRERSEAERARAAHREDHPSMRALQRERIEAEQRAHAEAEQRARRDGERQARAQAEQRARLEGERQARAEAEQRARFEGERQARAQAEQRARVEAERQARAQADQRARAEAEQQARVRHEAEQQARVRVEAEQRARAQAAQRESRREGPPRGEARELRAQGQPASQPNAAVRDRPAAQAGAAPPPHAPAAQAPRDREEVRRQRHRDRNDG